MASGSVLVGTLQRADREAVTLAVDFADSLVVERDLVDGFSTASPVFAETLDGTRLSGRLTYAGEGVHRIVDDLVGAVVIPAGELATVWPEGALSPRALAREIEIEARTPDWSLSIDLGLDGKSATTDFFNVRSGMRLERATPGERFLISLDGSYAEQEGEATANEVILELRFEVDVDDDLFAFVGTRNEFDEFERLDLRTTVSAGAGYFFVQGERTEIKGRVGLGFQHESFETGFSTNEAVPEVGYETRFHPLAWLRVSHRTTYRPILSDPAGDYRLDTQTAFDLPLGSSDRWRLRVGARNHFDSEPVEEVDELETIYFVNLGIDF